MLDIQKIGINLRSLLDGMLAIANREIDLNDYEQRNMLITKVEQRLEESDWISLSDGTTFERTFVPNNKNK